MRLVTATVWILIGAAVTGAAYWGLINTPESSALALATSLLLLLLTLALLSATINGAIAIWGNGVSRPALIRSFRLIPAVVPALLVFALTWWIANRLDTWVALRSGGINAWFIATFGWADVSWLFTGISLFTTWLRWVIGGLLASSLMAAVAAIGWHAVARAEWVRRGLRPRALIAGTAWFALLIALPWVYLVPWRPDWVPPTGAQLAFIIVKLSAAAVLMAAGVALMIFETVRLLRAPDDPDSARLAA